MAMFDQLKSDLLDARVSKNEVKRDILRVLIGELQTLQGRASKVGEPTNEVIVSTINKLIVANEETLKAGGPPVLEAENEWLRSYLPNYLPIDEIEAFFLNNDGPEFEQIREAKNEGAAIGVATKSLKAASIWARSADIITVVRKIRTP